MSIRIDSPYDFPLMETTLADKQTIEIETPGPVTVLVKSGSMIRHFVAENGDERGATYFNAPSLAGVNLISGVERSTVVMSSLGEATVSIFDRRFLPYVNKGADILRQCSEAEENDQKYMRLLIEALSLPKFDSQKKVANIFDLITEHGAQISPTISMEDIGRLVGLTRPRISRLVAHLREKGVLKSDEEKRQYRITEQGLETEFANALPSFYAEEDQVALPYHRFTSEFSNYQLLINALQSQELDEQLAYFFEYSTLNGTQSVEPFIQDDLVRTLGVSRPALNPRLKLWERKGIVIRQAEKNHRATYTLTPFGIQSLRHIQNGASLNFLHNMV